MNKEKPLVEYKIGDVCPVGSQIVEIIGQQTKVLVYLTEKSDIRWSIIGVTVNVSTINNRFQKLKNMISKDLPENIYNSLIMHLGTCLYNAFSSENDEEGLTYFIEIEKRILRAKTIEESRVYYLSFTIFYAFVSIILMFGLKYLFLVNDLFGSSIIYSAIAGITGSSLSIITRSNEIKINLLSKNVYIHLQVIIKLFIGLISGITILVSSKANLIVGLISDNNYMLSIFCLAAGFMERFIPEFLTKIEIKK